jgi:hypothetical protein
MPHIKHRPTFLMRAPSASLGLLAERDNRGKTCRVDDRAGNFLYTRPLLRRYDAVGASGPCRSSLSLVPRRRRAYRLRHAYLPLAVVDPILGMNHDLVVASIVALLNGEVIIETGFPVWTELEALQDLSVW